MLIREYIRESLRKVISERNYPEIFKKPFDYEMLICDYNSNDISNIYKHFKRSEYKDSVKIDTSVYDDNIYGGDDELENYDISIDQYANMIKLADKQLKLILPKNNDVIKDLEKKFNFKFSDTSIKDNKPIVFIPSSEIGSFIRRNKGNKGNNKIQSTEYMSWILHDLGHLENIVDGGIDSSDAPGVNLSDIDTKYKKVRTYINKQLNQADESFYWRGIIAAWFNVIGYTPDVSAEDLAPSIFGYCLSEMSSEEDALKMDFRILNDSEDVNVVAYGENKRLQAFFKETYKLVHESSKFSRFDSNNITSKLKDGCIYIVTLQP